METPHEISRTGMFERNLGMCSLHALVIGFPSLVLIGCASSPGSREEKCFVIIAAMIGLALASAAGCSILGFDMRGGSPFARGLRIALKARAVMVGLTLTGLGVGSSGFKPAYAAALFLSPDLLCRWAAWTFGQSVWKAHNLHESMPNSAQTDFIIEYLVSQLTFLLMMGFVFIVAFGVKLFLGRKRRRRSVPCSSEAYTAAHEDL